MKIFLESVAGFTRETIAPAAAGWSMGQTPDASVLAQAADLNLYGMEVPKQHGGLGLDFKTRSQACALLAAGDFGFAMSVVNTQNTALRLCQIAPPDLRDRYVPAMLEGKMSGCAALTEPGAGSDFAAVATRARKTPDGWVLNGEKKWIINGRHAGVSILYAQCGDAGDANGIAAFLVDLNAPGVTRYAIDSAFALTSMGTGGFTLDNVEVPDAAMLLPAGVAFKAILTEINAARTYVAAMCNGMMQRAVDVARDYGAHRHSFGKPLNTLPSWQASLAEAEAALAVSVAQTHAAEICVTQAADAQLAAAQAKVTAVLTAQQHLPALLQLMGAEGLRPEHPFTRAIGAAQIAGFTDGATNILKERIAKLTTPKETS